MKLIKLGYHVNKQYANPKLWAKVDDEDYEELNKYKWYASKEGNTFYAIRAITTDKGKLKFIRMHVYLLQPDKGLVVDHINRDGLDNQKHNLRAITHRQNIWNCRIIKSNKSGYRNVSWNKEKKRWFSRFYANKKLYFCGYTKTKEEAYEKYCKKVKEIKGEFAVL